MFLTVVEKLLAVRVSWREPGCAYMWLTLELLALDRIFPSPKSQSYRTSPYLVVLNRVERIELNGSDTVVGMAPML